MTDNAAPNRPSRRELTGILPALSLGLGLPLAGSALIPMLGAGQKWIGIQAHTMAETLGLFAGLMLASLLLLLRRYDPAQGHHLWTALGLLAMGVLDGFHAASAPGNSFVWLHSTATFFGGLFFMMVWLPARKAPEVRDGAAPSAGQRPSPAALAALTVLAAGAALGAASMLWPHLMPAMLGPDGFTFAARFLNVAGGAGFLAAALWFLRRLGLRQGGDFLFAAFALLFGCAGVLFANSSLWDTNWWFWHFLRLGAYALALNEVVRLYRQNQDGMQALNRELERRVAQRVEALKESESRTRAILDNAVEGIITIDRRGVMQSFNLAAERIFGLAAQEAIGSNVSRLMPEPHATLHDSYLRRYLHTGDARVVGNGREVVGRRMNGEEFPMDLAVSEIQVQGQPLFIGMVSDITSRKRTENMKSEFVSTVSHELRTPLTSIYGALGLVAGGKLGAVPPAAQKMVDIALKNSRRLTYLINDLLDIEKLEAGKLHFDMQRQPLLPLLEQAVESNREYGAERRVGLALEVGSLPPQAQVVVDSQRLMQVMSNLLSNAIKYSPEGGTVLVSALQVAGWVRVEVKDDGPGIPAQFQSSVFQKFAQADSSDTRMKGGTGLGLAITRELVGRMSGRIGFATTEGVGTTFHIELPLDATGHNRHGGADPLALRVLVVEDDPDIAYLLGKILSDAGYAVDTAITGAQALAALAENRYAAMTLDLMLPDVGGLEIIRQARLRPETASLPIIVVSAKMEQGKLAINREFSGIDWLAKPIDSGRLLALLEDRGRPKSERKLRVLHVEDDSDLHQVVRAMLGDRCQFDLATTLASARDWIARQQYDAVLLDLSLPDGSGTDLLPNLRTQQPHARILVLTGNDQRGEDGMVEDVLLKSCLTPSGLLEALDAHIRPAGRDG